uniref:Polyprotein n=1 Tax=Phanerochaete chrysosporium (strain RP-78 / ATCC MYA-4764 / FGSC 9002) TaxID=273507 RepID=Q45W64_PHACR|nr:polyprotein [Phanerochaete chrysosporium RP-78]
MSDAPHTVRIEPLKGSENYFSWSIQEKDILTELDLLEYATGETTCPEGTAATAWKRKDRKAISAIRLRCSPAVAIHITSCETAKSAWDTLKNMYATQGTMAKVTLVRRLQKYEMSEGADMEDELRKLTEMRAEAAEAGGKITDEDFAFNILSALPPSWESFVAAQNNVEKSSDVIGRVLSENLRRQSKGDTTTALVARNGKPGKKPKKSKFLKGVFCHGCGKEGHLKNVCRSSNQGSGAGGNTSRAHLAESREASNDSYSFVATTLAYASTPGTECWLGDSASERHIVRDRAAFKNLTPTPGHTIVGVGSTAALGQGDVDVVFTTPKGKITATLRNCLWSPNLPHNLLALGRLTSAGMSFHGTGNLLHIKDRDRVIAVGHKMGQLYRMDMTSRSSSGHTPAPSTLAFAARNSARTWYEWHCALGHINATQLQEMYRKGLVEGMDVDTSSDPGFVCDACIQAKHSRAPFPEIASGTVDQVADLIYSDIWGPARVASLQGNVYAITFTDAKSRFVAVDFMKTRDAALDRFQKVEQLIERQLGRRVKVLHVDNAKEYTEGKFRAYAESRGIIIRTTAPYSPAQNGVAERLNRTLMERARAMLIARSLPKFLWQEAWAYACYLRNRTPTRALSGKTPYEALWGQKPDVRAARDFGTPCWVLVPENRRDKLAAKSERYIFTGISASSAGWRYYVPGLRQVLVSRDVIFERERESPSVPFTLEGESETAPEPSPAAGATPPPPTSQAPETSTSESVKASPSTPNKPEDAAWAHFKSQLRNVTIRPTRQKTRIDYRALHETGTRIPKPPSEDDDSDPSPDQYHSAQAYFCYAAMDSDHPRSVDECKTRDDWPQWKAAMDAEMAQLEANGTWKKGELPPGRKAIGSKWVFAIKRHQDGSIDKYKARLVAQGFSQIAGQDYFDTFSPVVRQETFRVATALAATENLDSDALDIVGAYLHGPLEEEIYMRQAPGYDDGSGQVYVLIKALYGLKQAGRVWNHLLNHVLTSLMGWTRSEADPCLYFKHEGKLNMALVHVDDTALYGERSILDRFKADVAKHFAITTNGTLSSFVGLQVTRKNGAISILQTRYLETILERFGMQDCKPVSTPLDPGVKLEPTPEDQTPADVPYAAAIGSLMYAATGTRPDIAFAVQTLSQFTSRPSATHWTAVKHVFRYLKGTTDVGLTFARRADDDITGYSDADWAQAHDRRSVSGYAYLLAGGIVSWNSKKQPTVALSTMEAEYIALSHAAKEAVWLRRLLTELGFPPGAPTVLHTDNQAAISFAHDTQFHARSKHIDIRHHFIRERITDGDIKVIHCASADNIADMFTKALPRPKHRAALALANMATR